MVHNLNADGDAMVQQLLCCVTSALQVMHWAPPDVGIWFGQDLALTAALGSR